MLWRVLAGALMASVAIGHACGARDGGSVLAGEPRIVLRIVDVATGGDTMLEGLPPNPRQPSWSPDGALIAFTDHHAVWAVAPDSATPTVIAGSPGRYYGWPSWSPDGKRIAYVEGRRADPGDGDMDCDVHVAARDGRNCTAVTRSPKEPESGPLSWSSDGAVLAYVGFRAGHDCPCCLALDTEGERVVGGTGSATRHARVSPDGKVVAYTARTDGGRHELRVADLSDGSVRCLTSSQEGDARGPEWAPDGSRIAYAWSAGEAGAPTVMVVDLADGTASRVAEGRAPKWSCGGSRLAYITGLRGEQFLAMWDVSSGHATRLAATRTGIIGSFAWSPDDGRIVYEGTSAGAATK